MAFLIIGNIISFAAAVFTALSSWVKDKDRVFYLQAWQCYLLAIANFFFGSYAGISTLVLCGTRNVLVAKGKFTKKVCIIFLIAVTVLGIVINNRGGTGWIVIISTIIYTIGSYTCKKEIPVKINIIINLVLWMIYEVIIYDFVSFFSDFIALAIAILAIVRVVKTIRASAESNSEADPN